MATMRAATPDGRVVTTTAARLLGTAGRERSAGSSTSWGAPASIVCQQSGIAFSRAESPTCATEELPCLNRTSAESVIFPSSKRQKNIAHYAAYRDRRAHPCSQLARKVGRSADRYATL